MTPDFSLAVFPFRGQNYAFLPKLVEAEHCLACAQKENLEEEPLVEVAVVSKIQAGPKAQRFWVAHVQRTLHPEVHQNPGPIWLVNDPQVSILHVAVVHLDGGYWIEAADAVQKDVESLEKV